MEFKEICSALKLIFKSGSNKVPCIVGETGIGKTRIPDNLGFDSVIKLTGSELK